MTIPSRVADLSAEEAAQLAVWAQIGNADAPDGLAVLRRIGLLQLDPLRRVEKAHRLTCLARMPATASLRDVDASLWGSGAARVFETWVHAACLVPIEDWPLLRLARERTRGRAKRPTEQACQEALAIVADSADGVTLKELEEAGARTKGWSWSERKRAAEFLLWTGDLICSERRADRRIYDLPQRRVPAEFLNCRLSREQILVRIADRALSALGIATATDVATYYNLSQVDAAEALQLSGATQVAVAGWSEVAWSRAAGIPMSPIEPRLIGPFDNLIWDRERTRRVHSFDYVFEAYKPASKRVFGHYVMGALNASGRFIGRVSLAREQGVLSELARFHEPELSGQDRSGRAIRCAISRLARQLGLVVSAVD